jgi:hypothetical protein
MSGEPVAEKPTTEEENSFTAFRYYFNGYLSKIRFC